jgi:polysaccharide pyruvyl transferase WcaK-like protein
MGSPAALLLYTDGLTDTRNLAGKAYGQRRLSSWLKSQAIPGRNATELRDRLATELNRYRGDAMMDDDQAFLLLAEEASGPAHRAPAPRRRAQIHRGTFLFPQSAGLPSLT